jgi:TorA maturation chaperone TorD
MSAVARTIAVHEVVSDEDLARSRWYQFFTRILRDAPDAELLRSVARDAVAGDASRVETAADAEAPLEQAWAEFAAAAAIAVADPDAVRIEHDQVFVGVGKAQVPTNASYYLSGFLNERPLADVREHLASLGLSRRGDIAETEDHIASLCEVMAHLVAADGVPGRLDAQREFFGRFVAPWYERFADALEACDDADFYRAVARLLRRFLDVERLGFAFEV